MKNLVILILLLSLSASAQKKNSDEDQFRIVWKSFRTHIKSHNLTAASQLVNFPLYTAKSENAQGRLVPTDLLNAAEFKAYKKDIFNEEVIRILPKLGEENLSEIVGNEDSYYAKVRKMTIPGSKLYEVYAEYKQQGRNSESYFGFVFGKVKSGKYKVIAYYGKWPVR